MHDLETAVAEWRKSMLAAPGVSPEAVEELETHLRESVSQLIRSGVPGPEAFQHAVTRLGGARTIASEFRKLDPPVWWPVKLVSGIGILVALGCALLLFARFGHGRSNLLLSLHVFAVTVGYTATFLVGALGICFVGQRCLSDFSPLRMRSITRATFVLGCIALGLTAVGVVLGMVWARIEWGRYWAWDAKESAAAGIVAWQLGFLLAHRHVRRAARGILTLSVLGNLVVGLGWFGANLLSAGLHGQGVSNYAPLLLAAGIFNLAFFFAGLAPAGWLRQRKVS